MTTYIVGMPSALSSKKDNKDNKDNQCVSIRAARTPGERCPCKASSDSEWCGKHKSTQVRFCLPPTAAPAAAATAATAAVIEHVIDSPRSLTREQTVAATKIYRRWRLWLARRAGPLLYYREESNNPSDFFSCDTVEEIPLCDIVSFVSAGKGYIMDIKQLNKALKDL